ncbi:MAG: hypothetical protein FJW38_26030 [Acidobacteria bacterium]|nr:hypothetical protein [Acidobacteriota bacterium]
MARRIAIVGAGPSGLVTAKELLAEGHSVVCFARALSLGGVVLLGDDGVVWDSCRLTSAALATAFSELRGRPVLRAFDIAGLLVAWEIANPVGRIARRVSQTAAARSEQAVQ